MKFKTLLISIITSAVLLMSCEKEENKVVYHSYGIAYPVEGEDYAFKIKTDLGNTLIPNQANYVIDDITRVYATFSLVNEDESDSDSLEVDFIYMDDILYKNITTADSSLGDDAIYVRQGAVWQSDYNDVLNIAFAYDGRGEIHTVNLYLDTLVNNSDTVHLAFRHNRNADPNNYRVEGLVSFDLKLLQEYMGSKDSIPYQVSINRGTTNTYLNTWMGMYKGVN